MCRTSRLDYRLAPLWGPSARTIHGSRRTRTAAVLGALHDRLDRARRHRPRPGHRGGPASRRQRAPTTLDTYLTMVARDLTGRSPTAALRSSWTRRLAEGRPRQAHRPGQPQRLRQMTCRSAPPTPVCWADRRPRTCHDLGGPSAARLAGHRPGDHALRDPRWRTDVRATPAAIVDHLDQEILGRPAAAVRRADTVIRLLAAGYPRSAWSTTSGALEPGRRPTRGPALTGSLLGRAPAATWRARWTTMLTRLTTGSSPPRRRRATSISAGHRVGPASVPRRSALRVGTAGLAYRTSLHASGEHPADRFSLTGLPGGLGLQGSTLTGTPQASGSRFASATVRDAAGRTRTRQAALSISERLPERVALFDPAGPVDTAVLTRDGNDAYWFSRTDRSVTASAAPGNRGSSLRTVIVARNAPSIGPAELRGGPRRPAAASSRVPRPAGAGGGRRPRAGVDGHEEHHLRVVLGVQLPHVRHGPGDPRRGLRPGRPLAASSSTPSRSPTSHGACVRGPPRPAGVQGVADHRDRAGVGRPPARWPGPESQRAGTRPAGPGGTSATSIPARPPATTP